MKMYSAMIRGMAVVTLDAACITTRGQGITALDPAPGGQDVWAYSVSGDGSVVAGEFIDSEVTQWRAFRWTRESGLVSLGSLSGGYNSHAQAVNRDGLVIVGYGDTPGTNNRAFRWTAQSGLVNLGILAGDPTGESVAIGVNADGSVVVGQSASSIGDVAFQWTPDLGLSPLPRIPGADDAMAYGASDNGSVIVGLDGSLCNYNRAFRWSAATGAISLGLPAGAISSEAKAVSSDGTTAVGWATLANGNYRAFRWTAAEGMVNLGTLPGGAQSRAFGISGDGSMVVGESLPPGGAGAAFLWTPSLGMVNLNTYLAAHGIDLNGWELSTARAISADGRVVVGRGWNDGNHAWIVTLPGCGTADFNDDGDVGTDADIEAFFRVLAGGTC